MATPTTAASITAASNSVADNTDADLVVEHIVKEFPTPGEPLRVLDDVSLKLRRGESLAILGTLEPPTAGRVWLAGQDPFELDEAALAQFRSQQIGFVFQEHHLLPQCTVLENVLIPFLADGVATHIDEQHAQQLLDRVGLSQRLDHRPAELSGGERQRVAIARALVREPTLLLADEPTGNLDRTTAQAITELLLEMQAEANTILVVVTHSTALAAALGRRMELDAGQLVPRE